MMIDRLGTVPLVIQLPIGMEDKYEGLIDLIRFKEVIWSGDQLGAEFEYRDIRPELLEQAKTARAKMIETAVEVDDRLTEDYLNGKDISEADLKMCIRKGTIAYKFVPVLNGAAFKNKGVQPMLDAVVDFLPAPTDIAAVKGTDAEDETKEISIPCNDATPFAGLAFKIMNDPFVGSLTFVRVYSGKLEAGSYVHNTVKDRKPKPTKRKWVSRSDVW